MHQSGLTSWTLMLINSFVAHGIYQTCTIYVQHWCIKNSKNGLTYAFPEVWKGPNSDGEMTVLQHLQHCTSFSVVLVCTGHYLSKIKERKNQWHGHSWPRVTDASEEGRLIREPNSNLRRNGNGSDLKRKKGSGYTMHHPSWLTRAV